MREDEEMREEGVEEVRKSWGDKLGLKGAEEMKEEGDEEEVR